MAYENCIINDKISRSRCSYCRYQKCIKAGMKKEADRECGGRNQMHSINPAKIVKVDKCRYCGKYMDQHSLQLHIETTHPEERTRNLEDFFYKNGLIEDTIGENNLISNVQNVPNHFMSNVHIQNHRNEFIEVTIEPNHQIPSVQNVQNFQNVQIQNNYAYENAGTDTIKIEPLENLNTFNSANDRVLQVNTLETPKVNVAEEINIKEEPIKINKTAFLHYDKDQCDQIDIKVEPLETKEGIIQTDHIYAKDQTPNYKEFAIPESDVKIEPIDINISTVSSRYVFT